MLFRKIHYTLHEFLYNGHLHVRGMERMRTEGLYNTKMLLVTPFMIPTALGTKSAFAD